MDNTILVKTYPTRIEAEIGRSKLEANGIQAMIQADDAGGQEAFLLNATGFVRLLVFEKDHAAAKKLLL